MVTFLVAQMVKCLPTMWETWVPSLDWEDHGRRKWQPTPVPLLVLASAWIPTLDPCCRLEAIPLG